MDDPYKPNYRIVPGANMSEDTSFGDDNPMLAAKLMQNHTFSHITDGRNGHMDPDPQCPCGQCGKRFDEHDPGYPGNEFEGPHNISGFALPLSREDQEEFMDSVRFAVKTDVHKDWTAPDQFPLVTLAFAESMMDWPIYKAARAQSGCCTHPRTHWMHDISQHQRPACITKGQCKYHPFRPAR